MHTLRHIDLIVGEPQAKTLASRLRTSPHLGRRIESITYNDAFYNLRQENNVILPDETNFHAAVEIILRHCQPRSLEMRTDEMVDELWNNAVQVQRLEKLDLQIGDWCDDEASIWMPLVNRAAATLKDLHIGFRNDLDQLDPLLPRSSTHTFPQLERLQLSDWIFNSSDTADASTIAASASLLPLATGILQCTNPDIFQELAVDRSISHELVKTALQIRGKHLKKLGHLIHSQLPGMDSVVEEELSSGRRRRPFTSDAIIEDVSSSSSKDVGYSDTLATLTPELEQLAVRRIPLSALFTFPASLRQLRLWLPDTKEQTEMAELLNRTSNVILPSLKRLEVEIRSTPNRKEYQPVPSGYYEGPAWSRLRAACERRQIELVPAEPVWLWYD